MAQLPHQLGGFDHAGGLLVAEPVHDSVGVASRRGRAGVGFAWGFGVEMCGGWGVVVGRWAGVVSSGVAGLDECGFDVEGIDLVEHALDQAFHGVLGGAEWPHPRHPQRAARAAEDQISSAFSLPEVWKTELDDVQRPPEIGLELVADLGFVLILTGADDAVARAVGDDVDPAPMRDGSL